MWKVIQNIEDIPQEERIKLWHLSCFNELVSAIEIHSTYYSRGACCRGFCQDPLDRHLDIALQWPIYECMVAVYCPLQCGAKLCCWANKCSVIQYILDAVTSRPLTLHRQWSWDCKKSAPTACDRIEQGKLATLCIWSLPDKLLGDTTYCRSRGMTTLPHRRWSWSIIVRYAPLYTREGIEAHLSMASQRFVFAKLPRGIGSAASFSGSKEELQWIREFHVAQTIDSVEIHWGWPFLNSKPIARWRRQNVLLLYCVLLQEAQTFLFANT